MFYTCNILTEFQPIKLKLETSLRKGSLIFYSSESSLKFFFNCVINIWQLNKVNKTKRLIDTIASYNCSRWKMPY